MHCVCARYLLGYTVVEKNRSEALQISKGTGSSGFGSSATNVLHTTVSAPSKVLCPVIDLDFVLCTMI